MKLADHQKADKYVVVYTYVDVSGERGSIFSEVRVLDVPQVDLGAGHYNANQGRVVRSHALHCVFESTREVVGLVPGAPHCNEG